MIQELIIIYNLWHLWFQRLKAGCMEEERERAIQRERENNVERERERGRER